MSIRFRTNKAYELRLMVLRETASKKVHTPQDIADIWKAEVSKDPYFDPDKEHFYVFGMDRRNNLKLIDRATVGILDASLIHPREVFRKAIAAAVAAITVAHNHPSGDPSPSSEDVRITRQLVKAGKILDIPVLDHVIIGSENVTGLRGFISMREEGLVQF